MRGSPGPRLRVGSAVGAHGSQTRDRSAQPVRTPGLGMRVVRGTGIPCNPRVTGGETGLLSGRSLWRQHRSGWAVLSGCRGMPALGPVGCERPESSVVQTQPHVSRAGPRLQPSQPEPWTLRLSRPTSRPEHTVPPETETVSIARGGTTHTHTHTHRPERPAPDPVEPQAHGTAARCLGQSRVDPRQRSMPPLDRGSARSAGVCARHAYPGRSRRSWVGAALRTPPTACGSIGGTAAPGGRCRCDRVGW